MDERSGARGAAMDSAGAEVPVFPMGICSRIQADICQDGAAYLLHHAQGSTRIKAGNPDTNNYLGRVAGSRPRVAVAGYLRRREFCEHLLAYYAGPAEQVLQQLKVAEMV